MTNKQLLDRRAECINRSLNYLASKPRYENPSYKHGQNSNEETRNSAIGSYKKQMKITAITIAAIILFNGSYLFAFNTSRDVFNRTESQLSDVTKSMKDAMFDDYDCKVVTGTQVQSAYKAFEGQGCSIIINSKYHKEKSLYETPLGINYNALADLGESVDKVNNYYQCNNFTFKNGAYNLDSEDSFKLQNVARSAYAFNSKLIKDSTGEVVGISFEQK